MSVDRRQLLSLGLTWPLLSLHGACTPRRERTRISGDASAQGHRLWRPDFPEPVLQDKQKVLILGAGVAGCAAAYTLQKQGFHDYRILDLGTQPGGNARCGQNAISAYPLGAHYLPLPDRKQEDLLAFLQDAGALVGWSAQGEAIYNEEYMCHDPEDRVHYQGRWYEGLIPWKALPASDIQDLRAFLAFVDGARRQVGSDGRPLFHIPLDLSSQDPAWLRLDKLNFAAFIRGQGWHSPYLAWYLDYCCRDDYGTSWDQVSAWAGLHYFAARPGGAEEGTHLLTWPEGNAFLVRQLMRRSQDRFLGGELLFRAEKIADVWQIDSWNAERQLCRRWQAESLIVALPHMVSRRLLPELVPENMSYAPWMIANCSVSALPDGDGAPLAWDNVPYGSASLGYVVATHQNIQRYPGPSVLSCYWPLVGQDSRVQRMLAGFRCAQDWERLVLADLEHMHPGYGDAVESIDVWLWGHGMIQPKPGYIWGEARRRMRKTADASVVHAHSDRSGISIFEEAFAQGLSAARQILQRKGNQV